MILVNRTSIRRSTTRDSFSSFVREMWDVVIAEPLVMNWHMEYLCDVLQEAQERMENGLPKLYDYLIINVPPGSSKSTIISQMFPAWVWSRMPACQFICGSYSHAVALKDSLKTRDIVQSDKYQRSFALMLREDQNTKGLFTNTRKGFRYSIGAGGSATGFHGHYIIVDDPINPEEALSETELKNSNRWMSQTLPTRKVSKTRSITILVMQRLHQNDPTGMLLEKAKKEKSITVKHVCLPGELTDDISPPALKSKYKEGLLDSVRLPRSELIKAKADLGDYGYAGQILQNPVPLSGGLFKVDNIKLEKEAPFTLFKTTRYWDKAGTDGGGCYTSGVKMAKDVTGRIWIVDVKRQQYEAAERERMIKNTAALDGMRCRIGLEQEGGSGGKESAQNTVLNLSGYTVFVEHPTGSKVARAEPFATQVGAGNVYCLIREWTEDFLEELRFFPYSRYKDQVDAASGCFNSIHIHGRRKAGVIGK